MLALFSVACSLARSRVCVTRRACGRCRELADNGNERKRKLVSWSKDQRRQYLRLLVLVKWSVRSIDHSVDQSLDRPLTLSSRIHRAKAALANAANYCNNWANVICSSRMPPTRCTLCTMACRPSSTTLLKPASALCVSVCASLTRAPDLQGTIV